jgi:hypothetical protein
MHDKKIASISREFLYIFLYIHLYIFTFILHSEFSFILLDLERFNPRSSDVIKTTTNDEQQENNDILTCYHAISYP